MSNSNDFPLVEAPAAGRKGVFSIAMVLFSFTFFTGTMFAGGKLGVSFSIVHLLWIAVIGNALLALSMPRRWAGSPRAAALIRC